MLRKPRRASSSHQEICGQQGHCVFCHEGKTPPVFWVGKKKDFMMCGHSQGTLGPAPASGKRSNAEFWPLSAIHSLKQGSPKIRTASFRSYSLVMCLVLSGQGGKHEPKEGIGAGCGLGPGQTVRDCSVSFLPPTTTSLWGSVLSLFLSHPTPIEGAIQVFCGALGQA